MKSEIKRTFVFLLVAVFSTFYFANISRAQGEMGFQKGKQIKIGLILDQNLIYLTRTGQVDGYGAAYFDELAKETGWDYEYISVNEEEVLSAIETGKIDFAVGFAKEPEIVARVAHSELDITTGYGVLYALTGSDFYFDDFENFQGKKIAVLDRPYYLQALQEYLRWYQIKAEVIPCTAKEMQQGLRSGDFDLGFAAYFSELKECKIVGRFGATPLYIVGNKNGQQLMEQLDIAMAHLKFTNPYIEDDLHKKYYAPKRSLGQLDITRAEHEYLKQHAEIIVGYFPHTEPLVYADSTGFIHGKKGVYGLYIDLMNNIERDLGIKFTYQPIENPNKAMELLRSKKIDIILGLASRNWANKTELKLTRPIMDFRRENPISKKDNVLILPNVSDELRHYLIESNPDNKLIFVDNYRQCLLGIVNGDADYTYIQEYIYNYQMKNPHFQELTMEPIASNQNSVALGLAADSNPLLLSSLNKAIRALQGSDREKAVSNHLSHTNNDITLMDSVYPYRRSLVVTIILLSMAGGLWYRFYTHQRAKNERALIALRAAELMGAAKSDFLSRMSHEIRTPMNIILGLTELALTEKSLKGALAVTYLQKIKDASTFLLALLNDILDMSKIENNKMVINAEPVDSRALYQEIDNIIRVQAKNKGVNFIRDDGDITQPWIYCDKLRVMQIIINILSNAVKFTPREGLVTFQVRELAKSTEKVRLEFTVTDTGAGISGELLPKIFHAFEQAATANTAEHKGTGLGLAIVEQLVKLMEGKLEVASTIGEGTTMKVQLPFKIAAGLGQVPQALEPDLLELAGKRVLIAEDHPLNQLITSKLLLKKEMLVETVDNGQAAVDKFRAAPVGYYDAILMDIRMPVMDGLTATKIIRGLERADAQTVPILAMSANAFEEDIQLSLAAGLNEHLVKPVKPEFLYEMLSKYLH